MDGNGAATKFIDRLHGQMGELAAQPGMGRSRSEFGTGVRSFPIEDFLIFHSESKLGVDVIRVLSARRVSCAHSSSRIDPPIYSVEEAVQSAVLQE